MKKRQKIVMGLIYCILAAQMFAISASAYIDPATTSYIIQIAAGAIIALSTTIGICFNVLKRRIKGKKKETEENSVIQNVADDNSEAVVITAEDLMNDDD